MAHGHGAPAEPLPGTRRALAGVAAALALATVAGMALLWPGEDPRTRARGIGLTSRVHEAEVVGVDRGPCSGTEAADAVRCTEVEFRLTGGPDTGETRTQEFPRSGSTPAFEPGDTVVLNRNPDADRGFDYQFADRQRRSPLLWLGVLFAAAVIALGRWRGLAALVGLGASIGILLAFVLPALLEGSSPVLVAIVGSSAIAFVALYLAHGPRSMTTVALLGTLAALALTVGLAALFTELAQLSGFASEEAILVQIGAGGVDLQGLVLAGMVLGALGALDDVTVTQASSVWELRAADQSMSRFALYRAGLRIGRDHVASAVNTLALAYAGAALPLLILLVLSRQSLGTVANSEVVAVEIVRTLVGSIGLVAAVPVTTWLAAQIAPAVGERPEGRRRRSRRRRPPPPPADPPAGADEALAPPSVEDFWRR